MVVDFPAPFGPEEAVHFARRHRQVEPVEGTNATEALLETRGLNHSVHDRDDTPVSQICETS